MKTVFIEHVAFAMTLNCTLKCRHCSMLSPYIKESYNPAFKMIKDSADALFSIADRVEYINMTGGEPLLRERDGVLFDTLDYLAGQPDGKPEKIRIYTSGTVVPTDKLCEEILRIAAKKTFWFEIDDYGEHSLKLKELTQKLRFYNIKYNVRDYSKNLYYDGWVDFRLTDSIKRDEQSATQLFKRCSCGGASGVGFIDGVLVACPATYVRYMCGEIGKDHPEVLDLTGDREKLREKWFALSEAPVFESCLYCPDGICKASKRYMPAEQVTRDEVADYRSTRQMRY